MHHEVSCRIGEDGKPLLNRPDIEECMKRESKMMLVKLSDLHPILAHIT